MLHGAHLSAAQSHCRQSQGSMSGTGVPEQSSKDCARPLTAIRHTADTPDRYRRSIPGHRALRRGHRPERSRILLRDLEGAVARMRVGPVMRPAVILAFPDGAHLLQHADRTAAQRPDRGVFVPSSSASRSLLPGGILPSASPFRRLARVRDSEMPGLELCPRVPGA
jgi:hypothetical protein